MDNSILKAYLYYKVGLKAEFYGLGKEYRKAIKEIIKEKESLKVGELIRGRGEIVKNLKDLKEKIEEILQPTNEIGNIPFYDLKVATKKLLALFSSHSEALCREVEKKTAEDICKLLDDIELKEEFIKGSTLEEWRQWKHIRNAIRDKYALRLKYISKGVGK